MQKKKKKKKKKKKTSYKNKKIKKKKKTTKKKKKKKEIKKKKERKKKKRKEKKRIKNTRKKSELGSKDSSCWISGHLDKKNAFSLVVTRLPKEKQIEPSFSSTWFLQTIFKQIALNSRVQSGPSLFQILFCGCTFFHKIVTFWVLKCWYLFSIVQLRMRMRKKGVLDKFVGGWKFWNDVGLRNLQAFHWKLHTLRATALSAKIKKKKKKKERKKTTLQDNKLMKKITNNKKGRQIA